MRYCSGKFRITVRLKSEKKKEQVKLKEQIKPKEQGKLKITVIISL